MTCGLNWIYLWLKNMKLILTNPLLLSLPGSQCCLPYPRSAPSPGSAPINPTSTPSLAFPAWPLNTATGAPAAPRENGPLSSYRLWIPSKIPWSPRRASSCPPWTLPLTSRRAPCWEECVSTRTVRKLLCQILYRKKWRGVKWRRRRRENWRCFLWGGETRPYCVCFQQK